MALTDLLGCGALRLSSAVGCADATSDIASAGFRVRAGGGLEERAAQAQGVRTMGSQSGFISYGAELVWS